MDGKTLKSGAIGGVSRIKNPISLARAVMDSTDHCFLISSGAEQFAQEIGIPLVPKESLIHEWAQVFINSLLVTILLAFNSMIFFL
jgi:beta-aspartyl-peptidase (threonine type)